MGIGATAKGPEIDSDPVPVRTQPRLETAAARPCAFAKSRPRLPIPRGVHLRGPRRSRSPHPREHACVDAIGQRMDQPSEDDPLRISPSIWLGMASTFSSGSIESYNVYRGGTLRVTFTATQLSYRDTGLAATHFGSSSSDVGANRFLDVECDGSDYLGNPANAIMSDDAWG